MIYVISSPSDTTLILTTNKELADATKAKYGAAVDVQTWDSEKNATLAIDLHFDGGLSDMPCAGIA